MPIQNTTQYTHRLIRNFQVLFIEDGKKNQTKHKNKLGTRVVCVVVVNLFGFSS